MNPHLIAIKAALIAGQEIMKVYESKDFQIETKADQSPLTLADQKAHLSISSLLKTTDIPMISEEGEEENTQHRQSWEKYWLVDPLDGTKEFISKNGEFTVNIALIEQNKPIEGIIYVPVQRKLYFTFEGNSFLQENITDFEEYSIEKSVRLAKRKLDDKIIIVASKSHLSQETQEKIESIIQSNPTKKVELTSVGSSLKFCLLAEGKADFYPRYGPTMEWDVAAGHAICNANGVKVLKINSEEELEYNKTNLTNPWFEAGSYE